jgi:hypothetical protein
LRRRRRMFQQLFLRQRLRQITSAWASGRPAGGISLAGEEQRGRFTAEQGNYYRLYVYSDNLALAAMHLRRVRIAGLIFAQGAPPLAHVSTALRLRHNNSAWASGGPAGGRRVAACLRRWRALLQRGPPRRVEWPHRRCAICIRIFLINFFFKAQWGRTPRNQSPNRRIFNQSSEGHSG